MFISAAAETRQASTGSKTVNTALNNRPRLLRRPARPLVNVKRDARAANAEQRHPK